MMRDGTEARSGETACGLDPKDDGPVGATDAPVSLSNDSPTHPISREAVARIIDPLVFRIWQSMYDYSLRCGDGEIEARATADWAHGKQRDEALAKADQIISLIGRASTPAAEWREKGEPDPHGSSYDYERAKLCGGHLTDDQVAYQTAMLMRTDLNHEAVLQTAKDRIRWLSRKLVAATPPSPSCLGVVEALEAVMQASVFRDAKWAGMSAKDIARTALQSHRGEGR